MHFLIYYPVMSYAVHDSIIIPIGQIGDMEANRSVTGIKWAWRVSKRGLEGGSFDKTLALQA